jgi:hypothetical protein
MDRNQNQKDIFLDRFQGLKAVELVGNCHSVSSFRFLFVDAFLNIMLTMPPGPTVGRGGMETMD